MSKTPSTLTWYRTPLRALLPHARQLAYEFPKPDTEPGETLLISGAGYSASWGLPVTSQIPEAIQQFTVQDRFIGGEMVQPVKELLRYVQQRQGECFDFEEFTTWIVETGMADDVSSWDKLGFPEADRPSNDAEFYYRMLTWLFAVILLERDPMSEMMGVRPGWQIPTAYAGLEAELGRLSGIITLNYDVLPEHLYANRGIDYGFRRKDLLVANSFRPVDVDTRAMVERNLRQMAEQGGPPYDPAFAEALATQPTHKFYDDGRFEPGSFPVLKIHGGMNLVNCPACERAIVFPPWLRRTDQAQWLYPGYDFGWARSGGHQSAFHCKDPTGDLPPNMEPHRVQPLNIPPVTNKESLPEWNLVKQVQERAIQVAGQAKRIVVVGTSVRPADQALIDVIKAVGTEDVHYVGGQQGYDRLKALIPAARLRRQAL